LAFFMRQLAFCNWFLEEIGTPPKTIMHIYC
jgi:hypothetical protein